MVINIILLYSKRLALSGSSTTSGTSQLHGANHSFLSVQQFQTFEVQFANLDSLTQTQMRNIYDQSFRDNVEESLHFQFADLQSQLTTGFHTFCQTFELNGHLHDDGLALVNLIEIHVQDVVLYGVELDVLHDGVYLLAIDIQVNYIDVGSVNQIAQTISRYGEVDVLLTSVEYAGYSVVLTNSLQGCCLFGRLFIYLSLCSFDFNLLHCFENFCVTLN